MGGDHKERRRRASSCVPALIAWASLLTAGALDDASPLELYGAGGRSPALAGAGVTLSEDFASCYVNPAGLSMVRARQVGVGYMGGMVRLRVNGDRHDVRSTRSLMYGLVAPLSLGGLLRDRVTLGVAVQTPTKSLARVAVPVRGTPYFGILETRSDMVGALVSSGIRVSERWRLGVGTLLVAKVSGSIFIDVDGAGRFSTDAEQRLTTHLAPIVGTRFDDGPWRFGMTFRGESRADYDILVTNDLAAELPLTIPPLRIAGTAQYDPMALAAEASWRVRPSLVVLAELLAQRWSAYPRPTVAPVEAQMASPDPELRDTLSPRVAAEWTVPTGGLDFTIRGGYGFTMTPVRRQRGWDNLLDNHRHLTSLGFGFAWPNGAVPFRIDAWGQVHWLQPRSSPTDPGTIGSDTPDTDRLHSRGHLTAGGLSAGIDL